ncbi:MAG: hypothetical protein HKN91_08595 [Acidimicrobiia bacterium]|nr:hypothetical protein [Acidimicrobiia bacterium]
MPSDDFQPIVKLPWSSLITPVAISIAGAILAALLSQVESESWMGSLLVRVVMGAISLALVIFVLYSLAWMVWFDRTYVSASKSTLRARYALPTPSQPWLQTLSGDLADLQLEMTNSPRAKNFTRLRFIGEAGTLSYDVGTALLPDDVEQRFASWKSQLQQ